MRRTRVKSDELRLPAIEVQQGAGQKLYAFAVDGKQIPSFATISRIRRPNGILEGYQRPEVLSHVAEIKRYIESPAPMIPNAIVIAFDSKVRFIPDLPDDTHPVFTRPGTLVIPLTPNASPEEKPGFVVDGQQRLAAIREARVEAFPICITAFITDDLRRQTEQFILVNSTKPLPKGLIYELLPSTDAALPSLLQRRRFPAYLLDRLNRDPESPMRDMIQTPTNPNGLIKDNSILRMLENSLSDGALYRFRGSQEKESDSESMLVTLKAFWGAVAEVFRDAWKLPPRRSRLVHGAGIVSMGFVMDAITERNRNMGETSIQRFAEDLRPLRDICRWTDGFWNFGPGQQRKWNEIQNTSKDVQLLSNYLMVQYKALVWSQHGGIAGTESERGRTAQ
jgi:DGQHR domain-containing protein